MYLLWQAVRGLDHLLRSCLGFGLGVDFWLGCRGVGLGSVQELDQTTLKLHVEFAIDQIYSLDGVSFASFPESPDPTKRLLQITVALKSSVDHEGKSGAGCEEV